MIGQTGIVVFGLLSIWLANDPRSKWRRWGCVAGLCAQPFWFYETWIAAQWGIFGVSFLYAASWARGFWHQWIKGRTS